MKLLERLGKRLRAFSKADAWRFVLCVLLAVVLHGAGAISSHLRRHAHVEKAPPPPPMLIPVALEEPPPPPKPPAPKPPAPKEPTPVTPPKPLAEAAPPPPPLDRPRATANGERPHREPRSDTKPRAHHRDAPRPIDASAFGGKDGVFDAAVCLLPRDARSAHAVDGCEPVATFRTSIFDIAPRRFTSGFPGVEKRVDWFGIDYHGHFKVRAADYYTFRLLSDDGALLYIDGALVVDNDGEHAPREQKMSLPLSQGEHEFRLMYFQGPGGTLALELFVKSYKTTERFFGPEI